MRDGPGKPVGKASALVKAFGGQVKCRTRGAIRDGPGKLVGKASALVALGKGKAGRFAYARSPRVDGWGDWS